MSKIALSGNASGTGVFTFASPNSNTNRTLNLPDSAGTLLHDASSLAAANLTGTIAAARLPAGSVLQVVSTTYSGSTATSGTTLVDTGLSASITPTSASNKVLVLVTMNGLFNGGNSGVGIKLAILRGATNINTFCEYTCFLASATALITSAAGNYLDSPNTTSSTTYKVQFARRDGSGSVNINGNGDSSTIVLMEIAA